MAKRPRIPLKRGKDVGLLAKVIKNSCTQLEELKAPEYVRYSGLFYMCVRAEVYKAFQYADNPVYRKVPMDRDLDFAFSIGTFVHEYFQNVVIGPLGVLKGHWECGVCGKMHGDCFYPDVCECGSGVFLYNEYEYFDDELKLSGHIDGKLCLNRLRMVNEGEKVNGDINEDLVHLEIKSANDFMYHQVLKSGEVQKGYRVQACGYQKMTQLPRTIFLYFNVNSKDMFTLTYEAEPDLWATYVDKINTIWGCIQHKIPAPEEFRACTSVNDKKAKDCLFYEQCFLGANQIKTGS